MRNMETKELTLRWYHAKDLAGWIASIHYLLCLSLVLILSLLATYQVGLSFLTMHMRRAVAACTSPEIFFGANASGVTGESALLTNNLPLSDPLAYAMENLDISSSLIWHRHLMFCQGQMIALIFSLFIEVSYLSVCIVRSSYSTTSPTIIVLVSSPSLNYIENKKQA